MRAISNSRCSSMSKITTIENLPNRVLCHILSYLPTECAISTSKLATRWRYLWLETPTWDLNSSSCREEAVFVKLIDRFLNYNLNSGIKKFKLTYNGRVRPDDRLQSWIHNVITRRVSHLDISISSFDDEELVPSMPLSLYSSKTLVDLRLNGFILEDPGSDFLLQRIKTMHLRNVRYDTELLFKKLVTSCPAIEELSLIWHNAHLPASVRVHSSSLKRFILDTTLFGNKGGFYLEIDCPRLQYIRLHDWSCSSIVIHDIGHSAMVDLDLYLPLSDPEPDFSIWETAMHIFLNKLSTASSLKISSGTLEMIQEYFPRSLPRFENLSSLEADFVTTWSFVPTFLRCCPNLKTLILDEHIDFETDQELSNRLSELPQSFFSKLKVVQLKSDKWKLVEHFLDNCDLLEKLILSEIFSDRILSDIKAVTKKSLGCEIVVMEES